MLALLGWWGPSPCPAAAFGSQPSLLQCLSALLCVGCQRAPGLPGWGLLGLVQRGLGAPSQVEFLVGGQGEAQSHPGVGTCLMPLWKHHVPCFQEPWSRVPHLSPQETEPLMGRTRIPGPQMMADRIKRPIEGTFQGTCLLRERAKWKRSEHF